MSNNVYINACLPDISTGNKNSGNIDPDKVKAEILDLIEGKDRKKLELLTNGFKEENMTPEFYTRALSDSNAFIRNYFGFDLMMKNCKARFLNKKFGRPLDEDTIAITGAPQFEEEAAVMGILEKNDILERENGLDDILWQKIDEITLFNYFDIDRILAFFAKLNIVERWIKLDEKAGREKFRALVGDIRKTFDEINYSNI